MRRKKYIYIVIISIVVLIFLCLVIRNIIIEDKNNESNVATEKYIRSIKNIIAAEMDKKNLDKCPETCIIKSNDKLDCGVMINNSLKGDIPVSGELYFDNCNIKDYSKVIYKNGDIKIYINNKWIGTTDSSCFETADIGDKNISIKNYTCVKIKNNIAISGVLNVIIPDKINDKIVTEIGDDAFSDKKLSSVIIPDTVTKIGKRAFLNNNLESVKIPNSVTTIDNAAFRGNKLSNIEIPSSVKNLGSGSFTYNELTSVIIKGKSSELEFNLNGIIDDVFSWKSGYSINSNLIWEK